MWRLNLATTARDVLDTAEEPFLEYRVYVISDTLGATTNVPLQKEDEDEYDDEFEDKDQRDWNVPETKKVERLTQQHH